MHLQYEIKLPDHDFMVPEKHKLIPSVYAACVIDENGPTYSGPTLIRIRSGKHDKSTASSHLSDVMRLCELEQFDIAKSSDGEAKPIWLITVDGGPDDLIAI
uniref:Uncharacterized protein n=1 Tax=Acrobeloides nanus TaxID=290746 RepID=A0A914DCU3_9BILA